METSTVQLDWAKVHRRSCEFLDNVRLHYISSTERLIRDLAKFSHTLFPSHCRGPNEATAGQIWSEANIQREPVGEETPDNSFSTNNALDFTLHHPPPHHCLFSLLFTVASDLPSNSRASSQIVRRLFLFDVFSNINDKKSNLIKERNVDDGPTLSGGRKVETLR